MMFFNKAPTKKEWGTVVFVLILLLASTFILYRNFAISPLGDISDMLEDFDANRCEIIVVKDYFSNSRHDNLSYSWSSESGTIFAGATYRHIPISDINTKIAIDTLMDRGYSVILKREGVISFLRFGNTNRGVGIAYSIYGIPPCSNAISFLTVAKPLQEEGWFYFEVNFNYYRNVR